VQLRTTRASFNASLTQIEAATGPSFVARIEQIRALANAQFSQQLVSCGPGTA
jgi:hypothetical protein